MKGGARVGAWIGLALGLGVSLAACPSRDLTIRVSDTGVASLFTACRGFQKACSNPNSCSEDSDDQVLCELVGDECVLRNRCHLGDKTRPPWSPLGRKSGRLLLVSTEDAALADMSPCFAFDVKPCLGDRGCLASELNSLLDGAIKNGLTFDGFDAQEDGLVTLALFEEDALGDPACDPNRLVACAGLAPPLGGGDFDITCASCQDGSHFALGSNNGPCPTDKNECFLQRCERFLRGTKNAP